MRAGCVQPRGFCCFLPWCFKTQKEKQKKRRGKLWEGRMRDVSGVCYCSVERWGMCDGVVLGQLGKEIER